MVDEDRCDLEIIYGLVFRGGWVMKCSIFSLFADACRRNKHFSIYLQLMIAVIVLCPTVFAQTNAGLTVDPAINSTEDPRRLMRQAEKFVRLGSIAQAETALRRAVTFDSTSAAKVELAFVLSKQRKLLEAYDLSYAVVEAEQRNSRAYAVLGTVLLNAGRFVEARVILFNALKLNRREDLAWAGFGMLDFYENNINESLKNLQEADLYKPDEPDYLFALAQVSARAERYRDAADAYYRFLSASKNTDDERRARIKGLINFLRYLGQRDKLYASVGRERAKVKFDLVGNRPIINLKVNGRDEALRFVLDTGSGITVISEKTAKKMGIKTITKGGFARGIGGDGRFEIVYGFLNQVDIGDASVKNVPVYIRKFHDSGQEVDGYIGLSMISKFLTTIDYGELTFSLSNKGIDEVEFREKPELSLPLRLTSSGFLSGEVELEGIESKLNFIVDTGASVSVISDRVANSANVSQYLAADKLRVIGSAGITENVSSFMLPRVTFGTHTRTRVSAIALDLDIINEASGFEQAGILGGNFLKNYRLTFDFKNSKVTFTSVAPQN